MRKLANPQLAANIIVGQAACPACQILEGNPNAESRANLGNDGRISCVLCGCLSMPVPPEARQIYAQPQVVRAAVVALTSVNKSAEESFKLTAVNGGEIESEEGRQEFVAVGRDFKDIATRIALGRDDEQFTRLEILFNAWDVDAAATVTVKQTFNPSRIECKLPAGVEQAAAKLAALGFDLTGKQLDSYSYRSLTFVKGKRIAGTQSIVGVRASISWIVV